MVLITKRLVDSGVALHKWYLILESEHRRLPVAVQNDMVDQCVRHLVLYQQCGGSMIPKHHQFVHLTRQIIVHGNPKYPTTYEDESLNGVLKNWAVFCTPGRSLLPCLSATFSI